MSDKPKELAENLEIEIERLIPVEERQVNFYDDQITAALVNINGNQQIYVPLRPLCDFLGLDWSAQLQRTRRDEVLTEALSNVVITTTIEGNTKRRRELICLRLELLPGWLFGINSDRVKPERQDKLKRYRRECFEVLWQAFQSEAYGAARFANAVIAASTVSTPDFEDYELGIEEKLAAREPTEGQLALMQIREMGMSIARMADQQLEIERKADRANERLDAAREYLLRLQTRFDQRITALEDRLTPPADYITEDQVARLQLEVKALAGLLTNRDPADKRKNHYQGIFNELYRRFGVSSYTHIRLGQFGAVMQFLADWKHAADNNISTEVFLQGKLF